MNRSGLVIALIIGAVTGVVFGVWPQLDLKISAPFYDAAGIGFWARAHPDWLWGRWIGIWLPTVFAIAIVLVLVVKLVLPRRRMLIPGRAILLLLSTLALGPGLLANVILKDNWSRPRPIDVTEFQGEEHFVPWWDPRGDCPKNCSFIAGEPSGAFWTLAVAAVTPPPWQALAYGAALLFGAGVGLVRLAGGGHFASDIVFSGVFTFLVIWAMHGVIYRWRPTRITDQQVERAIERVALPGYEAIERLIRRAGDGLKRERS
jgi:lipid A 4'-phosphatase